MVRRLLVVLICFGCGLGLNPHTDAQVASPAVQPSVPQKAAAEAASPKIQEKQEKDAPKLELSSKPKPELKQEAKPVDQAKPVAQAKPAKADGLASERLLPASTKFWLSIPDADDLEKHFDSTQFGLLAKDPAIKPFIEGIQDQAKEILNDQNVRLGLEIDDLHGVHSGEICIAGILPELDGQQQVKGSHGLVLLVDVTGKEAEAKKLQEKINDVLSKRGATQETKKINGVDVIKSTIPKGNRLRKNQANFQVIHNGRMLVCDNEAIFRGVLGRLVNPKNVRAAETMGEQPSFKAIMAQTDLKKHTSHIRWYIDPFGYIQLAQALQDEERGNLQPRDDVAKVLKDHGFSAFRGIGGNISVGTGEHEILHRTFTYAPRNNQIKNGGLIFNLFDFSGGSGELEPAKWVPADCSAYIVGNWNYSKALGQVGILYDAFIGEDGAFKRMLNDFKVDAQLQLDIERLVGLIGNRMTMVSAVERPITESSERVVLGFPITGEPDFVFGSLQRATRGREINLGGIKVIEVDSAAIEAEDDGGNDPFSLPGEEEMEPEEPAKRTFELFAKRYFAVHQGSLLVANDKDYLKKLLAQKTSKLAESTDYIRVKDAIGKLTVAENVCWRQFGRMDKTLEANYEMLRRNEMGKSQTVLARLVNQVFTNHAAEKAAEEGKAFDKDAVRKQKLDGSELPKDYAQSIAPYFGPMGWVMEADKEGWRITGCVIKKKGMTEVVQKTGDKKPKSQQR